MRSFLAVIFFAAFIQRGWSNCGYSPPHADYLPVVDLGYERHQALTYNATTGVYMFSNIRYGQAPTYDLRFRPPLPPLTNRDVVQNGSLYRACPQGMPLWQAKAYLPISKYIGAAPFSLDAWINDISNSSPPSGLLETMNDKTSEDCLFLDVHVPRQTFERQHHGLNSSAAPVLVWSRWIHGGGFTLGSKSGHPSPWMKPDGLLSEASRITEGGMVFVALNYRLGALGFLAGPAVAADGALNAGLLDQRLALKWVQQHIHRFGGDPRRVTVMGESAGGGSLLHQLTAFGGANGSAPFAQLIAQSPGMLPRGRAYGGTYEAFLAALGVETLEQARHLPEIDLIRGNEKLIGAAPPNSYQVIPVTDGLIVPDEPGHMFKSGGFDHNVRVMAAKNSLEGGFFFDPAVETDADFRNWLTQSLAGLSASDADHLMNVLYPPQFDGSFGYVNQATRQMALAGEAVIDCNFLLVNEALGGDTFAYEFAVSPGLHIQDLYYTFDENSAPPRRDAIAKTILQEAIVSFAVKGTPNIRSEPGFEFPRWGSGQNLVRISGNGAVVAHSGVNATRCAWWHPK